VAKTLYATKRARPNTCTAIAFLTNESASTWQGWLEQTDSPNEISQRHAHAATDP
jgi:hypothetical protein